MKKKEEEEKIIKFKLIKMKSKRLKTCIIILGKDEGDEAKLMRSTKHT